MIIVKLMGGLGNQMFQYAIGRHLSIINNTALKLDLSFLLDRSPKEHFTFRDFYLDAFHIKAGYATNFQVKQFTSNDFITKLRRKLGRTKLVNERTLEYHPEVLSLGDNIYLDGYWQSEKYFDAIRPEILNNFYLKQSTLDKLNEDVLLRETKELMLTTNSVSIHFRRGDYVSDSVTNQFHGTCSLCYYQEAFKRIAAQISNPHFFLFTDDPEWLNSQKIIEGFPTTLAITSNMHLDMYLMSLCQHNIIANSSFSWWGAWLNRNPNKIVIAPKKWYNDINRNNQTVDLVPDKWIRI